MFYEYYSLNNAINERWVYKRKSEFFKLLVTLRHQGKFRKRFRMSEDAFHRLVSLLKPHLERDSRYSRSKEPMYVSLYTRAVLELDTINEIIASLLRAPLLPENFTLSINARCLFLVNSISPEIGLMDFPSGDSKTSSISQFTSSKRFFWGLH